MSHSNLLTPVRVLSNDDLLNLAGQRSHANAPSPRCMDDHVGLEAAAGPQEALAAGRGARTASRYFTMAQRLVV